MVEDCSQDGKSNFSGEVVSGKKLLKVDPLIALSSGKKVRKLKKITKIENSETQLSTGIMARNAQELGEKYELGYYGRNDPEIVAPIESQPPSFKQSNFNRELGFSGLESSSIMRHLNGQSDTQIDFTKPAQTKQAFEFEVSQNPNHPQQVPFRQNVHGSIPSDHHENSIQIKKCDPVSQTAQKIDKKYKEIDYQLQSHAQVLSR